MRYFTLSRFIAVLILTIAFGLTACGSASQPQKGSNSGTPISTNTAQSNTTGPVKVTPGQVTLVLNKSHYALDEVIAVTIANGLPNSIYGSAYRTNCTMVLLEWKTNNGWAARGRCPAASVSRTIQLKPDSTMPEQLTPVSGVFKPAPDTAWQPGTYRVSFFYNMTPDADSMGGTVVQTAEFSIG